MNDIAQLAATALRGIGGLVDRADTLDSADWSRPTLPGWTTRDLLDHCARALHQQSEAFENLLRGSLDQPEFPHPQDWAPERVRTELATGRDRMTNALVMLDDTHAATLTPLPFGVVPTPVAVSVAVAEYEMHRWDLEHALGNDAHELPDDVAAISFGLMGGLLPMLAAGGTPPTGALTIALRDGLGNGITFAYEPPAWRTAADIADASCTVTGSLSDLVMLTVGRISPGQRTLRATGPDPHAATAFKTWFPGP